MPAPDIRLARPDERDAIEDLQRRASTALPDYRDLIAAHPDAIGLDPAEIAAGRVLVAEADGFLAGFANWLPGAAADEAELDGLFVDPACWRSGIGRALVEAVAADARRDGHRRLTVVANPIALDFYRACGFVQQSETSTRFGPAPLMARAL